MSQISQKLYDDGLTTKLWAVGRQFSRLFLGGERWNLPFARVYDPSPIACLPADILGEIFNWSLCTNAFGSLNDRGFLPLEPLTLSHVNSRWRDVAISTPTLWSTIWVDRPRKAHVPMVELWLTRSRQCSLIIYLRQTATRPAGSQLPDIADPREFELTDEVLLMLREHLSRWKRVTFLFYKQTHRPLLGLPEIATAAPRLEHVYMNVKTWDSASSLAMERILYSYGSVQSVVVHQFMSQSFVRWERLTTLDAATLGCSLRSHLNVLKHCPSLRRAEIRCTPDPRDTALFTPLRRVRVPQLMSLTVHADGLDLAPFLDRLILPRLEGLVFRYAGAPRRLDDPQALWRLLACSACVLKRFSLKVIPSAPDDDFPLSFLKVPQMVSLTELYMQLDLTDKIVRFLTLGSVESGLPRVLPHLQMISLRDYHGDHIDDLELYRLVVSRLAAPGPDRNGRYTGALTCAYFHLRVKGHSASPVLPLLVERCRERIELRIYLAECDDLNTRVGWYTSAPIPGGYLTEG